MHVGINKFPQEIHSSALLVDGKIFHWKTGPSYWKHYGEITLPLNLPFDMEASVVENKTWTVNNKEEYDAVFDTHSKEWFKQWEMHEETYVRSAY